MIWEGDRMDIRTLLNAIRLVAHDKDAIESVTAEDGGPGSGNWGHRGRKGLHGGSAKGGGMHNRSAGSAGLSGGNTSK